MTPHERDLYTFGALLGRFTSGDLHSDDMVLQQIFDKVLLLPPEYRDPILAVTRSPFNEEGLVERWADDTNTSASDSA